MGSTWVVLTKSFLEFCVWGGTIFPVLSSCTTPVSCHPQRATSTLLPAAIRTSVNHNHYIRWDSPPKANPINLTLEHYNDMVQSGTPSTSTFEGRNVYFYFFSI